MVAGGLFNVFTGAGYLLKMINSNGYSEEIKRHNLAMEQLTRAQQKWNQNEIEEEGFASCLKESRMRTRILATFNKSLKNYHKVIQIVHNGKKFAHEPHLWDFYTPSEEMREYMTLAIGAMRLVGRWMGEKIISRLL